MKLVKPHVTTRTNHSKAQEHSLLVPNFHPLTNKTLFVFFCHVRVKLVVAIETFPTETTKWMDTPFDLFNWERLLGSVWDGG